MSELTFSTFARLGIERSSYESSSASGPRPPSHGVHRAWILAVGLVLLGPSNTLAFSFSPTKSEWLAWSNFCRALYASTEIGKRYPLSQSVPRNEVSAAKRYSDRLRGGIWHHCAGKAYIRRALNQRSKRLRDRYLRHAYGESSFTYVRVPRHTKVREDAGVVMGRASLLQGKYDVAQNLMHEVLLDFPQSEAAYSILYLTYYEQGQAEQAMEVLQRADQALQGRSAQINYYLGLAHLNLGNVPEARKYADRAYELGYPLPGLRNKLAAAEGTGQIAGQAAKAQTGSGSATEDSNQPTSKGDSSDSTSTASEGAASSAASTTPKSQ